MLLNAEKAAFFPLPLVLVARSGRRLRGCGLVAATAAAAAARLGVDMDSDHRVGVVIPERAVRHISNWQWYKRWNLNCAI